jgi:hypothetical protein
MDQCGVALAQAHCWSQLSRVEAADRREAEMVNDMPIKALAPWFGGKRNLAPLIVAELGEHRCYWEPFCGSMAGLPSCTALALQRAAAKGGAE